MPIPLVLCKPWGILPESMPCHPKLLSFCKYLHERGEKVSVFDQAFSIWLAKGVERGSGIHGEDSQGKAARSRIARASKTDTPILS